jgi:transcriptional regulator with XRE-family HTH domain
MNGKELRRIRKRIGWTQVQLAKALGISSNSVARQERNEIRISEPVAKLARIIAQQERRKKHG